MGEGEEKEEREKMFGCCGDERKFVLSWIGEQEKRIWLLLK